MPWNFQYNSASAINRNCELHGVVLYNRMPPYKTLESEAEATPSSCTHLTGPFLYGGADNKLSAADQEVACIRQLSPGYRLSPVVSSEITTEERTG